MRSEYVLVLAFFIGVFAGLRSMTAPAVTAWAARCGWLSLRAPLSWLGSLPAAILFTLCALGELVADKLPKTPSRTAPVGLIARILTGALSGAAVYYAGSNRGYLLGAILGAAGGVAGCFGGYLARKNLVKALGTPDYVVAVVEDLVAIAGSLFIVSRF